MNVLAKLFMRMWILRANPQDLPASQVLTYGLAFVYVVISTLSVISRISLPAAFAASMLDLGLLVLTVHALLAIAKVPERGMQTLSAIFGASQYRVGHRLDGNDGDCRYTERTRDHVVDVTGLVPADIRPCPATGDFHAGTARRVDRPVVPDAVSSPDQYIVFPWPW